MLKIDYSKWLTATPPPFEEWTAFQSGLDRPVLKSDFIPNQQTIDFQNISEADCSILCENSQLPYVCDEELWAAFDLIDWRESGKIYGQNDWISETVASETVASETVASEYVQQDTWSSETTKSETDQLYTWSSETTKSETTKSETAQRYTWSRETNSLYEHVLSDPTDQLPEFELRPRPNLELVHPFFRDLVDCFESNEYNELEAAITQEVEKLQEHVEYELEDGEIYEEPPALPKPMTRLIGDDDAYNNGLADLSKEIDRLIYNS